MQTIDLRGRTLTTAEMLAAVPRATAARAEALATAAALVEDVRVRGESALREQAERFDRVVDHAIRVPKQHIDDAVAALEPRIRSAIEESIRRVRAASEAQVPAPA
ncbi:histidinol dehydrogenase, partial [Streptomyces sp. MS2A]|nr:histidinol dehydrogenase [Streptomyces sp. MS2A]